MTVVRQASFAGGELSPSLHARTDLAKYAIGAKRLRNFIVTPHGTAANRPGTRYGASTRLDEKARLLDFTFSDNDTLVLAFTAGALRSYNADANGRPGAVESSPGVPYEIATPYTESDLPKIRHAQVGDVVRFSCPGRDLYELTRTSASPLAFTWSAVSFIVPAPLVSDGNGRTGPLLHWDQAANAAAQDTAKPWEWRITAVLQSLDGQTTWETKPLPVLEMYASDQPAWSVSSTYAAGDIRNYNGNAYLSLQSGNVGNYPNQQPAWWERQQVATAAYAWKFAIPEAELVLTWTFVLQPTSFRYLAFRLYQGRGNVFGYIGEVVPAAGATTARYEVAVNDVPDFALSPPQGRNPFQVYDGDGNLARTEQPGVVAYHDQRFVAARTAQRPGAIFFSRVDDFSNFDKHAIPLADDALEFQLAATRWEEIRALVPGRVLLCLTSGGEWAISGGKDGETITALGFGARERTRRGSSWVEPVKVGDDAVLFFPSAGNVVRSLAYDGNSGTYAAPDVTTFSKHLFAGRQIVDRAWQEEPWSVLWVVLDDGKLLSLSYVQEHELIAWAWHDTQGAVESVCAVREGAEDALWLVVRRTVNGATKRFIERMETRQVSDAKEGLFLDCALTYRGAPATHFSGLDHLEGCTVNALADGNVVTGLVVSGGAVDLPTEQFPDGASLVHVGLPYVSDFESLDPAPGEGKKRVKVVKSVALESVASRGGYVGPSLGAGDSVVGMEEWLQRDVAHGYGALPLNPSNARLVEILVADGYGLGGRAAIRQVDPLPLTILAVTRDLEYGG